MELIGTKEYSEKINILRWKYILIPYLINQDDQIKEVRDIDGKVNHESIINVCLMIIQLHFLFNLNAKLKSNTPGTPQKLTPTKELESERIGELNHILSIDIDLELSG